VALDLRAVGRTSQTLDGAIDLVEGRATFDLRELAAGPYKPRLVVSTADASWMACIAEIPLVELLTADQ
jgi:hypothetical protein